MDAFDRGDGGNDGLRHAVELALLVTLERIESRLKIKEPAPTVGGPMRDLIVFAIALLVCVAVAVVCGVSQAAPIAIISAFVLGLCGALAYNLLAPMLARRN
jgi:hypothetical protein